MSSSNAYFFFGAVVVGLVSAAGVFLIEHFRQERRRHVVTQNLARMDQQLSCMKKELEQLRKLQKEKSAVKLRKHTRKGTVTTVSDDFKSATDLDSSDLEYYDLSDEELNTNLTVTPIELTLQLIDEKLDDDTLTVINEALEQLNDLWLETPEDDQLLWRIGKAHYKIANISTDSNIKDANIQSGIIACQSALKHNPNVGEVHKWLATLIGLRAANQPIKEKISDGYLFKEHLDKAVDLLPNDSALRHMLGRFAYETASLKWYERKVASTFFAEPPSATYDEALDYFLQAECLAKVDWKENKLFIAKSQIALGKYQDAARTLNEASSISRTDLVSTVDAEIEVLLEKYNGYS